MQIILLQHDPVPGDFSGNARQLAAMARDAAAKAPSPGQALCVAPLYPLAGVPWGSLRRAGGFYSRCREGARLLADLLADGPDMLISLAGAEVPLYMLVSGGQIHALMLDGNGMLRLPGGTTFYMPPCPDGKIDLDELPPTLPGAPAAVLLTSPAVFLPGAQCGLEVDRANLAQRYGLPVLAACQCGATDGLVYAGQSTAHDAGGTLLARARAFEPDAIALQLDEGSHALTCAREPEPKPTRAGSMFRAAVLAVRDYARKCGVKGVLLGLSGGMDSALVACIAVEALGAENVFGVLMPSRFSSGHSQDDAQKLADALGMRTANVCITPMMDAFSAALAPSFAGLPARPGDLTADNLQPRIRGTLLMAFANRLGYAVLGTGNKSENAMGYCTLYGDTVGALEPIGDVYKTEVYDIAAWYNGYRGGWIIPRNVFDKPPSAELHPDQVDEDNLPPYPVLDTVLRELLENAANPETLTLPGVPESVVRDVARRLAAAEFKRHQSPPAVKMSSCTLGIDWHMPASARYV